MAVGLWITLLQAIGLFVTFLVGLTIYRLYFSPLAKYPGPKIAAVTSLYHFYYDVIRGGQYTFVIEEMHKKYGPIVRIRPDVLHMNDPEFIDPIFGAPGKRRDKYKVAINGMSAPNSALGTYHHDLHRARRSALNPFFSKANIRRLEPVLKQCLAKCLGRLERAGKEGTIMTAGLLYSAVTSDIISDYCFGESYNNLDKEDLNKAFFDAFHEASKGYHIGCWNPWIVPLMTALPQWVVRIIMPQIDFFINLVNTINKRIKVMREEIKDEQKIDAIGTTVFHGLASNPNLPDADKTDERLLDEARVILGGGTDTSALSLAAITYHLLANPPILKKLKAELLEAIPDLDNLPPLAQLEALPYLGAVIQEGMRIHPAACIRQERVAPDEDILYEEQSGKKWVIEKGTPVGMSPNLLGNNEILYPSPRTFRPERYIENPRLVKYQLAFSRGSRKCLGMNLAYSELYTMLAGIFRTYDLYDGTGKQTCPTLELFETDRSDVEMVAEFIVPYVKEGSLGVRLRVR